ncbi:NPCBM/NEW2 domain-containing protein, partial [Nocardia asteroides]|uniref:NPCBM/NEW2 domain-containing protein n=1 Tax=Nocardia asteroides TaxID=1824 RepID=UPI0033DE6616
TGLKARDQAETARFEAEQRAAMVANALVAGGGANTSWSGLPSGGTWYKLAEFQPVRGTTESLATREVVVQGLSYPTALVGYTRDGAQSVTYALSKSCVAFSAMAGVDDRSQGASTRLHAMVDKRTVTTVYRGAGDVPVSVNFSVRGASELSLQVDQTPMGLGTIGAWIGAQVYCTAPPGQVI